MTTSTTSAVNLYEEEIPSAHLDIFAKLRGSILTKLVRYSWLSPQEAVINLHLDPPLVFRRTVGPLVMSFVPVSKQPMRRARRQRLLHARNRRYRANRRYRVSLDEPSASGLAVGFASLEEKASVTLWVEVDDQERRERTNTTIDDPDLHPIDATDSLYSEPWLNKLIGQQVEAIFLLKRDPISAKDGDLPREVGLLFRFANGQELILSHQLHEGSESFAIVRGKEIQSKWNIYGKEIPAGQIIRGAEIRDGRRRPRYPYPIEMPYPNAHRITPKVHQLR